MTVTSINLRLDAAPLFASINELSALTEAAQVSHEFCDALVRIIKASEQLVSLENDLSSASGAGVAVIRANPSDRFLCLLATCRAGNFDALAIEQIFGHESLSVGSLEPAQRSGSPDVAKVASGTSLPDGEVAS